MAGLATSATLAPTAEAISASERPDSDLQLDDVAIDVVARERVYCERTRHHEGACGRGHCNFSLVPPSIEISLLLRTRLPPKTRLERAAHPIWAMRTILPCGLI